MQGLLRSGAFALVALTVLGWPASAVAQQFNVRGFVDAGIIGYWREAPNDATRVVADAMARLEPSIKLRRGFSIAGSFEARADTHDQGGAGCTYWDRTLRRPTVAVRSLTATLGKGPVSIEIGKQFVRWGQSDILSPTDYFTARDYVITTTSEALAITAARLTLSGANNAVEFVYAPRLTPSRMPLLDQRWIGIQSAVAGLTLKDGNTRFPSSSEYGVRYHRTGHVEYSATFFQGPHHLPLLDASFSAQDATVVVGRHYPDIRALGGDVVTTGRGLTIRAEGAWLQARSKDADNYGLWVVQGERQQGSWLLIGGYVGEWVTEPRGALRFAPDRGLARSVIGRVSRLFDDGRNVVVEGLARQNGDGIYVKAEYSQAFKSRWRVTLQVLLLGGRDSDFLGQYRRNSLTGTRTRYSF